uniref:WD40-like Beta Propeller Repeat n=1 Tax=Candidatus Kentrum sp. LFY TaxID=2126342 RepID=A0A450WG55_9GAMM|nr:MAG: WD40-like Beta Propeller Repeat [Candidatus Kentron sp. LFY]
MKNETPHFELRRVFDDGSEGEPEVVQILQWPGPAKMSRRSFLGAGIAISGALGLMACSGGDKSTTSDDNTVGEPEHISGGCDENVQAHRGNVNAIAFSPDGKWLASGGDDGTVKLWEISIGKLIVTLRHGKYNSDIESVSFSPDGELLASGGDWGSIKLWEMPSGKLIATLDGHKFGVRVSFSPDGKWLASGGGGGGDGTVKLWEMPSGKLIATLKNHEYVSAVSFSPDGKWLASGGGDGGAVRLWEIPTGKLITTPKKDYSFFPWVNPVISFLSFSPDGKWLAFDSGHGTIKLWEVPSGQRTITLDGHKSGVEAVAFSSDGKLLASGSWDGTIKLWAMLPSENFMAKGWIDEIILNIQGRHSEKLLVATLKSEREFVRTVAFSLDGKWLVSGGTTIKLWEIPSGKFVTCLFDPATLEKGKKALQYTAVNQYGQSIIYTLPCDSSLPAGATCTCNCVPGTYSPPPPSSYLPYSLPSSYSSTQACGSPIPPGATCTCNCVPYCQAHKVLDPDPVIRIMAEESLLLMGKREFDYMRWAGSTSPKAVCVRIHETIEQIQTGAKPNPSRWPDARQCLGRLDHADQVVSLMAAHFLEWIAMRGREKLDTETTKKAARVIRGGRQLHELTRKKVEVFGTM